MEFEDGFGVVPLGMDVLGFRAFVLELLDDALRAKLLAHLEREASRHSPQVAADERARRLTAIDTKVRTAWYREELHVVALEANGVAVDRRGDADPATVPTVALPEEASASAA